MTRFDFKSLENKRTLILGDVNSGKTTVTHEALEKCCHDIDQERIAIIDMAPVITLELVAAKGLSGVGGALDSSSYPGILYLKTDLAPPRLCSQTEGEVEALALVNAGKIETLFEIFIKSKRDVLFINDLTLYLQAGSTENLGLWLDSSATVVANGYQGKSLGQGRLSLRENEQLQRAKKLFDTIIEQARKIH